MSIEIKIFLGYFQNKELSRHLQQSDSWKEAHLLGSAPLKEISYEEKEYIGFFINQELTYSQIKLLEDELKKQLLSYCPQLNLNKYSPYLFPQIFLS